MVNNYIPRVVKIARICEESADIKTFHLECRLDFKPGQFLEVSCFGKGEVPISIASSPGEELLRISFKRVGAVTEGLFELKENNSLGIRGPFGNGFPLDSLSGADIVFIAGGIGIAPLRPLLKQVIFKRQDVNESISLLYGARTPKEMLYKEELKEWQGLIKVMLTVDNPDDKWRGCVGRVPQLLNEIRPGIHKTKAFICGPEVMMRFSVARLIKLGVSPQDIFLSLERHMKCGAAKCGHCYIADKFVCKDGPVFSCEQLSSLIPEEIL